jgi:hypothetical protein
MTADQVSADLVGWPPNSRVSMAAGTIVLAGVLGVAARSGARSRA